MKNFKTRTGILGAASAAAAMAVALSGCYTDPYYYDPYAYYGYYYPTGYAYADPYYVDYGYSYGYPLSAPDYTAKGTSGSDLPGAVVRDLARGVNACPDHATVTTTTTAPACDPGGGVIQPLSTSISFDGCVLLDGSRLDGSIQIDATQTASDAACDDNTTIDVTYTSKTTQLVYTAADGSRIVIPQMTRTGSYTRPHHAAPAAIALDIEGSVERYDASGTAVSNVQLSGGQTLTLLGVETGFVVNGTLTMQDSVKNRQASVTATEVTRAEGCCYPTSGSLDIVHTEGDSDHWTFAATCGDASVDGHDVTLDSCF
jgi:hypothetical protein